jgi:hypothetical protein
VIHDRLPFLDLPERVLPRPGGNTALIGRARRDTINGDLNPFAGSTRGKAQFMHTAFEISPAMFSSVPVRTLGGGLVGLPMPNLMLTTSFMNTEETAQHDPFVHSDGNNWGVTGWMNLTADVQYIDPGLPRAKDSVVLGLRLRVDF